MRCPYCGAEARGRFCEYCDSEMPGYREEQQATPANAPRRESAKETYDTYAGRTVPDLINDYLMAIPNYADAFGTMQFDQNGCRTQSGKTINRKLLQNLKIADDENIYLIHDDTLFQSGKNGFAITSTGFRCIDMFGSVKLTTWDSLARARNVVLDSHLIRADGTEITYFTGDDRKLQPLLELCHSLKSLYESRGQSAIV